MTKIKQHIIDDIAQMEADALLENLNDPEMRKNPAFLAKVRQFFKDNDFLTTVETEGVKEIIRTGTTIPDLVSEEHIH